MGLLRRKLERAKVGDGLDGFSQGTRTRGKEEKEDDVHDDREWTNIEDACQVSLETSKK